MKKTIFLVSILITLFIGGCYQKDLIKQIDGTWNVQNYSVNGANQTHWFDSVYSGFKWTFSGNSNDFMSWQVVKTYTIYNLDTIVHYDTTTHAFIIDSITSSKAVVPTVAGVGLAGQWLLTNGNHYLQTQDSIFGNRQFQIISHSNNSLHLLDGNKDYYLSK
jgi:hypothetical protein